MWAKEIKQHVPSTEEALLVNAGEEASKVLVVQAQRTMFRSLAKNSKEMIDITGSKMVRAGNRNELGNYFGKNVQHRSERSVHKGNDGTSTGEVLFLLGQNIAGRELTALANSPRIGPAILLKKLINQR